MTLRCLVEKTELGMYYFKIYFFILQNLPRKFSIEIAPNLVFFFKERLLSIESKFKALGAKSALLKKGDGCSGDVKEEDYLEDCDPLAIDLDPTIEDTDQRNTSLVDKDTILPKISNVSSLGTIHILRHHIFGIFGPPSPPLRQHVFSTKNKQKLAFSDPPPPLQVLT